MENLWLVHFDKFFSEQTGEAFIRGLVKDLGPLESICADANALQRTKVLHQSTDKRFTGLFTEKFVKMHEPQVFHPQLSDDSQCLRQRIVHTRRAIGSST